MNIQNKYDLRVFIFFLILPFFALFSEVGENIFEGAVIEWEYLSIGKEMILFK